MHVACSDSAGKTECGPCPNGSFSSGAICIGTCKKKKKKKQKIEIKKMEDREERRSGGKKEN